MFVNIGVNLSIGFFVVEWKALAKGFVEQPEPD